MLNIIKGGLRQQVSEQAYENLYKPHGWRIDETAIIEKDEIQETVKTFKTEGEIKSYIKMTKHTPKQFNDKLFKSEEVT